MTPLRIAVVGIGYMGRRHARKIAALRDADASVTLSGVCDLDLERAGRIAEEVGAGVTDDLAALLAGADAAIIAVPTLAHFRVARAALDAGVDVLIEKPIAAGLEEAEELMALAERGGRVLQVGHQEWFNPAICSVRERIRSPRFVEGHRLGPFRDRATDVDVVRDLMIHDLDILQQLLGEEPVRVEALGVAVLTDKVDVANVRLGFPGGCVANLTASRVSAAPVRKLRIFQRDGYFAVDFLSQSASVFRRQGGRKSDGGDLEMEELKTEFDDTLAAQLRAFVAAVKTRQAPARAALGALRTALRVVEAMKSPDR